jgi:hypothetical protein
VDPHVGLASDVEPLDGPADDAVPAARDAPVVIPVGAAPRGEVVLEAFYLGDDDERVPRSEPREGALEEDEQPGPEVEAAGLDDDFFHPKSFCLSMASARSL